MTDLGDVSKVLGMNVTRDRENGTITIDQKDYTEDILERYGMTNCNVEFTPVVRYRPQRLFRSKASEEGKVAIHFVKTEQQLADLEAKRLKKHRHRFLTRLINEFRA